MVLARFTRTFQTRNRLRLLPRLVDPGATSFGSVSDMASAMRRAAAAHDEHEKRIGEKDANWPDWYAVYMTAEASGAKLPE